MKYAVPIIASAFALPVAGQAFPIDLGAPQIATGGVELAQPIDMAVAPNGDLIIADLIDRRVVRVSADGELRWEAGRLGNGPGEFQTLLRVAVSTHDTILALDANSQEVSWFRSDGTFVRRGVLGIPMSQFDKLTLLSDGTVMIAGVTNRTTWNEYAIHSFDPTLRHVDSFAPLPPASNGRVQAHWGAGGLSIGEDGALIFTRRLPYEIYRFERNGKLRGVIAGDLETELGPDDAYSEEELQDGRIRTGSSGVFVPRPWTAIDVGGGLVLSGVIASAGTARWDVFDEDGNLVSSWAPPKRFRFVSAVDRARRVFYVKGENAQGEPVYWRVPYRMQRGNRDETSARRDGGMR